MRSKLGPFWALSTSFLGGTAAAGGIAMINSLGNLGGYVGPDTLGKLKHATHGFGAGLLFLAAWLVVAGIVVLFVRPERIVARPSEAKE
jgi:ACS family tartrate transporter-like MFS transporter